MEEARTEVLGLTIDSASTRDIDDAIWVEEVPEGFRVLVSIADVSSAVPVGSRTELRARVMVETKYRATWNLPMLPRALAENRLSLWAGQKRDSVTIEIILTRDLQVRSTQLYLSTITSKAKLSHEDVPVILGKESPEENLGRELKPVLLLAQRLALGLLEQRRSAGALVLYDLNNGWVTTEEGHLKQLDKKTATIGYIIIQELMVLANASVAEWVIEHNIPVLFRNHEARAATPDRAILVRQLQDAIHTPLEGLEALKARVHMLLSKADYGTKLLGHYGLNLPAYLHFTSPIRRYADFVNHRQIVGCLGAEKLSYSQERLEEEASHINSVLKADRDSLSEHMKNKAEKRAQRNATRGRVETLNMKDFERLMKVEARSGQDVSDALREGFLKRLPANLVPPACLTVLLAEAPSSPIVEYMGWVGLKEAAIQWMKVRPELAITVATMATQTNEWPEIKYVSDRLGLDHNPIFKVQASFKDRLLGVTNTAEAYGSSVKAARQKAALCILALHSGLPAPSEFTTPPTQESTLIPDVNIQHVNIQHKLEANNHVSILQEYCQAKGLAFPTYEFELSGPSHAPMVTCTCKFGQVVGTAKAGNKQDAKRLAAKIVAFSAVGKA